MLKRSARAHSHDLLSGAHSNRPTVQGRACPGFSLQAISTRFGSSMIRHLSFVALIILPGSGFSPQDLFAETLDCFVHLGIEPGRVRLYQTGVFPDDPDTWCLVRCVAIKLGVYGDRYGPDVGRLYEQFRPDNRSEVTFKQAAYDCLATLLEDEVGGACERAYRMMIGCFGDQIRRLVEFPTELENRTNEDPCVDCYRMFDELYRYRTLAERKSCGKCGKPKKKKKKN